MIKEMRHFIDLSLGVSDYIFCLFATSKDMQCDNLAIKFDMITENSHWHIAIESISSKVVKLRTNHFSDVQIII